MSSDESPYLMHATGVKKAYGTTQVLDGVEIGMCAGQVKAILGPSGAGKSTLLRVLALLEPADAGELTIAGDRLTTGWGRPVPERDLVVPRQNFGMVFQSFNLFPHLAGWRNVALALEVVSGLSRSAAKERAFIALAQVGMADHGGRYPAELSGGQQQRIAIARALVMNPRVMMFDEPTSALDPSSVDEVLGVIAGLAREGMTMLVVTHEIGFARNVADQIAMFDHGRIVEEAPPESFFGNPRHESTKSYVEHLGS